MFLSTLQALDVHPHLEHPMVLVFLQHPELQAYLSNLLLLVDLVHLFFLDHQLNL